MTTTSSTHCSQVVSSLSGFNVLQLSNPIKVSLEVSGSALFFSLTVDKKGHRINFGMTRVYGQILIALSAEKTPWSNKTLTAMSYHNNWFTSPKVTA